MLQCCDNSAFDCMCHRVSEAAEHALQGVGGCSGKQLSMNWFGQLLGGKAREDLHLAKPVDHELTIINENAI